MQRSIFHVLSVILLVPLIGILTVRVASTVCNDGILDPGECCDKGYAYCVGGSAVGAECCTEDACLGGDCEPDDCSANRDDIPGCCSNDCQCPSCVPPPSGLVSWWPLEMSGPTAFDIWGSNNGTYEGDPRSCEGLVGNSFASGVPEQAFVQVPDNDSLDVGVGDSFTIDAWIKTTSADGVRPIIDKRQQDPVSFGPNRGYHFYLYDGRLGFQMADAGGPNNVCDGAGTSCTNWTAPSPQLDNGAWHHVAVTVDRGSAQGMLYVDGNPVLPFDTTDRNGSLANEVDLLIGKRYALGNPPTEERFFDGCIDEVEFFDRALGVTEISDIVQAGSNGKCKCGNGIREGDEECDGTDDDACPGLCLPPGHVNECKCPVCPNGVVEPPECCDDGNLDPIDPIGGDDICSPNCECAGQLLACKFDDRDANGERDWSEEPGLGGWEITISTSPPVTLTTDAQGCVDFFPLPEGWYTVTETSQSGWVPTTPTSVLYEVLGGVGQEVSFGNAQESPDHLKCYKIKDPQQLKGIVDLDTPQFGLDPNCKIKKGFTFCVPGTKVVQSASVNNVPITPIPIPGLSLTNDYICYKVRCRNPPPPDTEVADQFGNRTLSKLKAYQICVPAVKACNLTDPPECPGWCPEPLTCMPVGGTCDGGPVSGAACNNDDECLGFTCAFSGCDCIEPLSPCMDGGSLPFDGCIGECTAPEECMWGCTCVGGSRDGEKCECMENADCPGGGECHGEPLLNCHCWEKSW